MVTFNLLFPILSVSLSLLIAAVVACIAYWQHSLAKERFKLDMFEKRFAVYKATQRFLSVIFRDGKVDLEKLSEFRRDTQDATFLFGQEIPAYLKRLDVQALNLVAINDRLRGLQVGEERSRLCREKTGLLHALIGELPNLKNVFASYLKFDKWK
ncbi:MAG TPA: hypothetical protein VM219_02645 [Phycisphaerae bacterium]|nr:hypothetical protein [Phycisphaerae bacterium]